MSACIPETSYFATPKFLSTVLHGLSVIEIAVHLLGAWIIVVHTPSTMASVKWPMLNLHFWSSFLDLSISLLTIPFVIFPAIAGFPLGLLSFFETTVWAQCHGIVTLIGFVIVSTLLVYENRYFLISQPNRTWEKLRIYYIFFCYILTISFMIPFSLMVPEQKSAVKGVFERLPCLPQYVYEGPVFVYTRSFTPIFATVISLVLVVSCGIVVFITLTIRCLLRTTRNRSASAKTLDLQKKFLFGLVIQTTIPVLVVLCPIAYMSTSLIAGYYNQAGNNFLFIVFSLHGIMSTSAMLLMHKPYRTAASDILFPCCSNKTSEESVVNSTMLAARKTVGRI